MLLPDAQTWHLAGIMAGTLARTQEFQPHQRQECLNDAPIYLTAARQGLPVLTANRDEFDLIQQIVPGVPLGQCAKRSWMNSGVRYAPSTPARSPAWVKFNPSLTKLSDRDVTAMVLPGRFRPYASPPSHRAAVPGLRMPRVPPVDWPSCKSAYSQAIGPHQKCPAWWV